MADQARPTTTSSEPAALTITIGTANVSIAIPRQLSLRVARLHAIEQVAKVLKGPALAESLKALGFK